MGKGQGRARALGAVLWVAGCVPGGDPADEPQVEVDPRDPGSHRVGWRSDELSYTTVDGRTRALTVQVFYPTDDTEGGPVTYRDGFPSPLPGILGGAAPVADGTFPLLVHSHGHVATGGASQPLGVWLGSHGWVVVAPDHVPDTFAGILGDAHSPPEITLDRAHDLSAALDWLAALPEDHPLRGRVDTARAMVSGHSRGVGTVWSALGASFDPAAMDETCAGCGPVVSEALLAGLDEPRFAAGIGLAGTLSRSRFGVDGERTVAEPFLSLTGSADDVGARAQAEGVVGVDLTWVELAGGCHESFASGIPCPGIATDLAFRITGTYALAFGRRHVLGEEGPLVTGVLDGSVEVDPSATMWVR